MVRPELSEIGYELSQSVETETRQHLYCVWYIMRGFGGLWRGLESFLFTYHTSRCPEVLKPSPEVKLPAAGILFYASNHHATAASRPAEILTAWLGH